MTKLKAAALAALVLTSAACNWWPELYDGVAHLRWSSNSVEFAQCSVVYGAVVCFARQSELGADGCMGTEPNWCVGQPPPSPIDMVYVVNY